MEMLDSVQIAKPIELTEIDYAVRHTETKTYSQKDPKEKKKLPKGKCTADDLVDIITNHRQNPAIWNVNKIAEHLELRPSETEDFLAHFELVDEHSSFILQEIHENQETASYNDPFSVDHELKNKNITKLSSRMFLLILGSFCLSILLVFTIAYLWIYLGHFNAIEVGVKTAKFAGKAIAYKEYDEDFDYIPARYREVLTDYPGHISCGIYEKYNQDDFEGKYKIGVLIETEADVLKGYDFEYLPQDQFCVCSDFNYNDPIQIRVGLKKCLDKMKEFILARELKIETFYEVYEPNCAHYVFTLPNQPN